MYLPEEDKYSISKEKLESQISSLFGGRIAEEMTLGPDGITTGASNDIERATDIARNMVGSVVKEDTADLAVLKEYVTIVAKKRGRSDKACSSGPTASR